MYLVKAFGFLLAAAVLGTSLAMYALGARWQKIEAAAYSKDKRPAWFYLLCVLVLALYGIALYGFWGAEKNWASWSMMVALPALWLVKTLLVAASPAGRRKVSSISGSENWRTIALARLPAALILAMLAWFA